MRTDYAEWIRETEEGFETALDQVTAYIRQKKDECRVLMLAGPSSSGKTTTSLKLSEKLLQFGISTDIVSLDNFYLGREMAPLLPNGRYDYEALEALNLPLLEECLSRLMREGECDIPKFDFRVGTISGQTRKVTAGKDRLVICEGIHALNPRILANLPHSFLRLYVCVIRSASGLIAANDLRLLRRLVRDYRFRDSSATNTFHMWDQVRRGEKLYIQPFADTADITVDTLHGYEPCVLRRHALPLLAEIPPESPHIKKATALFEKLSCFPECDAVNLIPKSSLIREFIGGGKYKYS